MKINMFQFYKRTTVCFWALAAIVLFGTCWLVLPFWTGSTEDYIILLSGTLLGVVCLCFPILLNYRQLTHVLLDKEQCTSYSFLNKKLCDVDFRENVFYSVFYVRFAYAPSVKFIALSNEPFVCKQFKTTSFKKTFYGTYNQKEIIIIPYNEKVTPYLNLDKWQNTGDGLLY